MLQATTEPQSHGDHPRRSRRGLRRTLRVLARSARTRDGLFGVRKKYRVVSRTFLIWRRVVWQLWLFACFKRRYASTPPGAPEVVAARRKLAIGLRDTMIALGATFVKLGQLLSTRVDVLPREVIEELSLLQNDVPGFPVERALRIINRELGKPADEVFASFDRTPLAAQEVVVKVQRENLRETFDVDLFTIRIVAALADRLDPQTEGVGANWKAIAETSGEVLYREIDFNNERMSAEEFAANFAKLPNIKVPRTYPEYCSARLITLEYCPGIKVTDTEAIQKAGYDPIQISDSITTSYLEQVCRHGFFHCDPHPGNLAVDGGCPGGRLIYYDFGMMERVENRVKKGFVDLVFSIYENLPKAACDSLEVMGVLRPGIDRYSIERIARNMLDTFQTTLASADNVWENEMTPEQKKESRRERRAKLGGDLFATQAERPFLLPPKFTFVFRAFSTIDGIGKELSPRYDLARISQPYLRELADLRDGSSVTTLVKEVGRRLGLRPEDIAAAVTQPRAVASVADTVKRLEEGDLKLRVRTLEVERLLERVELRQQLVGAALGAVVLLQWSASAPRLLGPWLGRAAVLAALRLSWEARSAWAAMASLEAQRLRFENQGDSRYDDVDFSPGVSAASGASP